MLALQASGQPGIGHLREHVRSLTRIIIANFRTNENQNDKIRAAIAHINGDIYSSGGSGRPTPHYIVKMRTELGNIDKLTSRIRTISGTSFIPAAYAITEISVAGVVLILFFVKIDPYREGMVIFTIIVSLLISIILLIKDMDNPFHYSQRTFGDVDLSPIFELEKYQD